MAIDDDIKANLKSAYEDVVYVENQPEGDFAFRRPTRTAYAAFLKDAQNERRGADKLAPFETLCHACLVFPVSNGKPEFGRLSSLFERLPALAVNIGAELSGAAGGDDSVKVGKL